MPAAARVGDQVAHTKAVSSGIWGAVKGALVGALIGAAVIGLAVVTGGAALVVIGASLVAGGTVLGMAGRGFQNGVVEGQQNLGPPCGPITTGSANVFIEKKPAALACLSLVACSQHGGPPVPVATGSQTVFINTHAAARVGDLGTACGFVIRQGSGTVTIGADKASCHGLQPGSEVPEWANDLAEGAIFVGGKMVLIGSILSLAGAVRAITLAPAAMRGLMTAQLGGGLVGGYGGAQGGNWLGGKIFGEGSVGQQAMAFGGGLLGGIVGGGGAGRLYGGLRGGGGAGTPPVRALETRSRVLANIEQSRAARQASRLGQPPPAAGTRTTTRAQWNAQSRDARLAPFHDRLRGSAPNMPGTASGIPSNARVVDQWKPPTAGRSGGYRQVRWNWNESGQKYEARWHTRTPGAPANQGDTYVVQRTTPGSGGTQPSRHILTDGAGGQNQWARGSDWFGAVTARQNGTATPAQEALLDSGHFPAPPQPPRAPRALPRTPPTRTVREIPTTIRPSQRSGLPTNPPILYPPSDRERR